MARTMVQLQECRGKIRGISAELAAVKRLGEFTMYAIFAVVVGAFSSWPSYEMLGADRAIVSLVFSHAGERIGECRRLSQDELNKLPPNMRKPADCPRERHPVRVEFRTGEQVLYKRTLAPSGIWADGEASIYFRVEVDSGAHDLFIGMNDSGGEADFDVTASVTVELPPGRNLVIQFDEQLQQFLIR
jgi:hypothetical protein